MAGYAEVLGTAGLRWPVISDRLSLGVRASLGLAGGGNVDTGGGLLAKAAAGATLRLTDTLGIGAEIGVVQAVRGTPATRRSTGAVSLNWALDAPQSDLGRLEHAPRPGTPTRMEFGVGRRTLPGRAQATAAPKPLEAVVLQINRFVAPNVYLTGPGPQRVRRRGRRVLGGPVRRRRANCP